MKFNIDVKVILQEWLVQLINMHDGSIFVQTRSILYIDCYAMLEIEHGS